MDPGKLDLARQLFVHDHKSLADICITLDISMFVLKDASEAEGWLGQREKAKAQFLAEQDDTLAQHKRLSQKQLRWMNVLLTKQQDENLTWEERKLLRGQMETALAASQALAMAVDNDRKIHGVKNSAPSVAKDTGEAVGVRYSVAIPPTSEPTKVIG